MELVFGRMVVCAGSSMRVPRMALPSTSTEGWSTSPQRSSSWSTVVPMVTS